ncbi:MAG: hypothetical protein OEY00_10170, partial [Gammaproteobacteria bacterium]|nr:hypothetical protein [Gammaproteobacteria bacterium]
MLWKYLSVLCASIALFCFAQNSLAEYSPQQPREDNLLILGLKIDYLEIQELVPAYRADDEFYLPISILGQILGLSVNVDLGTQSATGFIIDEDRQFQLNVKQREIILSGILQTFPQHQVFVYPDDIYVNSKLLQQWWPMSFELNLFTSQVLIKTREKLPFQQRMKREADIEKMRNRYTPGAKNFPKQDTRYSLISTPFIDQRISANYSKDKAGNVDEGYNYSTHIKTDLLYHEASLFLTGNNEEDLNSTRFNVSRTDPDGGLLSFMNATRYSFWNIFTPSSEYVSTSKADVVGITASNYPLNRQNQYDKHTFEGELLPDWEVELYHNNVLIAYKDKPDNGRYRFEDIP